MKLKHLLVGACLVATGMTGAIAQNLPKTHLRVVGSISTLPQYKDFEQPFWTRELAERSGGAITGEIRGFNEMGLKGPEVLRMMGMGAMEIGATSLFYLAADDPINEMIDIAGMLPDVQSARKATDASKPVYEKLFREKFGVELLGFGTYPGQVVYCNAELKGLAELKGKKVRVAGRSQSELIEALGATPVTMAFGEVVPAMQNKTVDCAVTGTLSGNLAKWHEVATHMIATPISWGQIVYAVNAKTWARMDSKVREFIDAEVKRLEKNVWDAAAQFTEQGYACNAGRPDCKLGTPGKMTLVQLSKADREQLQKIVKDVMLPKWAARCSAQCVSEFNATVGKTMNLTASK